MNGNQDLLGLARDLVDFGLKAGADEIEVTVAEGTEFSVDVRLGKIENLLEAGSRAVTFRLIKDKKTAYASSSDLNRETLRSLCRNALQRASLGSQDEYSGLPPYQEIDEDIESLQVFDPEVLNLETNQKIDLALKTEKIALENARITNSHGANFESKWVKTHLANSNGFAHAYEETFCSLSVGLQAGETDAKVEDFWFSSGIRFRDLDDPEAIARKAVERTVRQLHPRKVQTQNVPVILEPMMTSWLLGFIFSCVSGVSVYRKASFLADKLGEHIGNGHVRIIDDGQLPGKPGTRPYDAEGVPTRRTSVINQGRLEAYLCDTYSARKLGLSSTGNAEGNGVGPNNFYWMSGPLDPDDIISSTERGLLLTRTIGHGLNPVSGDISTGAYGLWIDGGQIIYPVSEITISGNLGSVLKDIDAVGNDLEFRNAVAGPTLKIGEMTISGK